MGAPNIRDVVFDLGGVLVDWNPRNLYVSHLREDREEVERFLGTVCTPDWHAALDAGQRFEHASALLLDRYPGYARWIRDYSALWEFMFDGPLRTLELLRELRRSGYTVHALSNYPGEKIAFLYERFEFMREFRTVVLSGLLGFSKPDPAIYRYLLERVGAEECIFIDDRPENIAGARACGIRAVQFDRHRGPYELLDLLEAVC